MSLPKIRSHVHGKKYPDDVNRTLRCCGCCANLPGLTETKCSCGEGLCGSCMVLMDGEAVRSCVFTAIQCCLALSAFDPSLRQTQGDQLLEENNHMVSGKVCPERESRFFRNAAVTARQGSVLLAKVNHLPELDEFDNIPAFSGVSFTISPLLTPFCQRMAFSGSAIQGKTASGLRKMSTASSMSVILLLLKPANRPAQQPRDLERKDFLFKQDSICGK